MYLVFLVHFLTSFIVHDLHLSMCHISYNDDQQRIEIQQRIFFDDLEQSLRISLSNPDFDILDVNHDGLDYNEIFAEYMNSKIEIVIDGKPISLEILSYEIDQDAIVLYLYKEKVKKIKEFQLYSEVLFELFSDQANIISVEVGGKKKSARFLPGTREKSFNF